jgi:hypothetical protein
MLTHQPALGMDTVMIDRLREQPDPTSIELIARLFARHAFAARDPAKSLAALIRFRLQDERISGATREAVRSMARTMVEQERRATPVPSKETGLGTSIGLREVARLLGQSEATVKRKLVSWEFRRYCGWPCWDPAGQMWRFAARAFDFGGARETYFSSMPARDPYEPPSWCEKQP